MANCSFCKELNFSSILNSQKFVLKLSHPSIIGLIYCWTCSRPEYAWNISRWTIKGIIIMPTCFVTLTGLTKSYIGSRLIFEHTWHNFAEKFYDIKDFVLHTKRRIFRNPKHRHTWREFVFLNKYMCFSFATRTIAYSMQIYYYAFIFWIKDRLIREVRI